MPVFEEYEQFSEALVLTIQGHEYEIPVVGIATGLEYKTTKKVISSSPEFQQDFLGAAYDEMIANNVPMAAVARAALTAYCYFDQGPAVAKVMWATGGDPKAIEAYERDQTPKDSTPSKSTGKAKKTQ